MELINAGSFFTFKDGDRERSVKKDLIEEIEMHDASETVNIYRTRGAFISVNRALITSPVFATTEDLRDFFANNLNG